MCNHYTIDYILSCVYANVFRAEDIEVVFSGFWAYAFRSISLYGDISRLEVNNVKKLFPTYTLSTLT